MCKSFAIVALAASLFAFTNNTRAADVGHDNSFMDCAKACDDCARSCTACASHCAHLIADGKREHLKTLGTCADCSTVCRAASAVVAHHGQFSDIICTACAEACKRCGAACDEFKDDTMMKDCASECHKCEKACREMLEHADR
ncbi:MAG TPA: hypothetical protein VH107_03435 [Lacipirellulaceae bacterium]|jgi:hypothetical protein|nr:hypothetical protein [Lacipirellulaceae bacterium]